jgi:predicted signal transduction protein with EAL and GGDEF domain
MVARLGGDEFVVVASDVPDEHAVVRLGRRLIERIEQPYDIDDSLFGISASVGVATLLPGDAPLDVIHRADSAVYLAKDLGRARVEVYDQEFQSRVEQRAEMELAMRDAIAHGDLKMYLQPVFDLSTGRPVGAEALARWERPGVGFVSPAEFVAIAENSSLIVELTRAMLANACERIAAWRRHDPDCSMRIAVNLSGRHLIEGDLISDLVEALSVSGADPRLLELELTETQLLADLEPARQVLETVRAMGVTVAVDDFGTGFSSMAYLRQLQVDVIKVDRSFVAGAGTDGFDATAIDAMVNFGRVLGVEVVAEGVETEEQLAFVRARGCTRAQGFLLGMPLPVEDTERVLFGTAPTVAMHAGIER